MKYRIWVLIITLVWSVVSAGCGGGLSLTGMPPDEQLSHADDFLKQGKGDRALEAFRLIARTHPGTEWEERARLGIARSYREIGDYFAAVQDYESFQRRFSRSPLVADAMLEIGLCYLEQQANPEYDQEWNPKAIRQLEEFLAGWPESPRAEEGRDALFSARRHIARKELENAITYKKLRRLNAARFYFNLVAQNWGDTPEAAEAVFEVGRTYELEKNREEALAHYRKLVAEYPSSEFIMRAEDRISQITSETREQP